MNYFRKTVVIATILLATVALPPPAGAAERVEWTSSAHVCSSTDASVLDVRLTKPIDIEFHCRTGKHSSFRIIEMRAVGGTSRCTVEGMPSVNLAGKILLPTGNVVPFEEFTAGSNTSQFSGSVDGFPNVVFHAWTRTAPSGLGIASDIKFGGWALNGLDCHMRNKTAAHSSEIYFYGYIAEKVG